MSKPRRPEDGEDVRRRLLLFLAATDGLSPREIADALERTAAGEYGTAVEAICSGLHENNSRISGGESENLTNLVLTLGLPEACSNRVIEQTDAKLPPPPRAGFNEPGSASENVEDVDSLAASVLESSGRSRRRLTGSRRSEKSRNGRPAIYVVEARVGGIDAQAFVDEHDSVVVSANHSAGRDNFEDRILRRLLINAAQVPQLPQSDFVNVIQLVGRRQWAAALTVLCTQVHERRLPFDWRRTKAVIEAGEILGIDVRGLLAPGKRGGPGGPRRSAAAPDPPPPGPQSHQPSGRGDGESPADSPPMPFRDVGEPRLEPPNRIAVVCVELLLLESERIERPDLHPVLTEARTMLTEDRWDVASECVKEVARQSAVPSSRNGGFTQACESLADALHPGNQKEREQRLRGLWFELTHSWRRENDFLPRGREDRGKVTWINKFAASACLFGALLVSLIVPASHCWIPLPFFLIGCGFSLLLRKLRVHVLVILGVVFLLAILAFKVTEPMPRIVQSTGVFPWLLGALAATAMSQREGGVSDWKRPHGSEAFTCLWARHRGDDVFEFFVVNGKQNHYNHRIIMNWKEATEPFLSSGLSSSLRRETRVRSTRSSDPAHHWVQCYARLVNPRRIGQEIVTPRSWAEVVATTFGMRREVVDEFFEWVPSPTSPPGHDGSDGASLFIDDAPFYGS